MTEGIDYGLLDIASERARLIRWLGERISGQTGLGDDQGRQAAAVVVAIFQNDLQDANAYRWLASQIQSTMADPDGWDFDEAEESALMGYIRHMATATHGDCGDCGRRIAANEHFELVGRTREGDPVLACMGCVGC